MFQKIQNYLSKIQKDRLNKQELLKAQKYYKTIQSGALFLKFIEIDIEQMKKNQINRHMRRRFEHSLDNLELNKEMVEYYQTKIDNVLDYIHKQLHPAKPGSVKINKEELNRAILKQEDKNESV
jgi:hypothetical protein